MGNIEFLVMVIGSVVFFTLLLVAGNTMAIAVRERTPELAVLKTVGFTDLGVLGLVMAETLIIAGQGGVMGLLLAKFFTLGGDPTGGFLGILSRVRGPWVSAWRWRSPWASCRDACRRSRRCASRSSMR